MHFRLLIMYRSSDIRVIISAYRIEKTSDDHPYTRYTAKGLVIFDHPYNADSARRPLGLRRTTKGAYRRILFLAGLLDPVCGW